MEMLVKRVEAKGLMMAVMAVRGSGWAKSTQELSKQTRGMEMGGGAAFRQA